MPGPKPVALVGCRKNGERNALAVSYQGQVCNGKMYVSIRPERYSNQMIRESGYFSINYMERRWVKEVDFCGIVSGRKYDKFSITQLTEDMSVNSVSPLIKEAGKSLDCRLEEIRKHKTHDEFIGEVLKTVDRTDGQNPDWLFHDNFLYYGREGRIGEIYKVGRELIPSDSSAGVPKRPKGLG